MWINYADAYEPMRIRRINRCLRTLMWRTIRTMAKVPHDYTGYHRDQDGYEQQRNPSEGDTS